MTRIDDQVRASLQQRAADVEVTPALWTRVDARLRRRQRLLVVAWGLVGATSVLAAIAVLPGLLTGDDPRIPEIVPIDPALPGEVDWPPMAASTPEGFGLLDVARGSFDLRAESAALGEAGVAVRRGSTVTAHDVALVSALGSVTVVSESSFVVLDDPGAVADTPPPTLAWAADAPWLAIGRPTDEGTRLSVRSAPTRAADGGIDEPVELAVLPVGTRVLDWVGPTLRPGDRSHLLVLDDEQLRIHVLERTADGWVVVDGSTVLDGIAVLTAGFVAGDSDLVLHTLARQDGEVVLRRDRGVGGLVASASVEVLADADPAQMWLQAREDLTLFGDGSQAWVVTFQDGFGGSQAVGREVSRAGLLAPGSEAPEPAPEAPHDPEQQPGTAADAPGPLVLADGRDLVLLEADGPVTLMTLPAEGESHIQAVAVRPGSTVTGLVVVSLTEAEGLPDLRWTEVVDGEVRVAWELFPPAHRPSSGQPSPPEVSRPVWSPDGDSLAWLERQGDEVVLRIVGWGGSGPGTGDSATDNASFVLGEEVGGLDLRLEDWVLLEESAGRQVTALRALDPGRSDGALALRVTRGPDGAWSLAATAAFEVLGTDGPTLAYAGLLEPGGVEPRWVVQTSGGGLVVIDRADPGASPVALAARGIDLDAVGARDRGDDGGLLVNAGTAGWFVPVAGEPRALSMPASDLDWVR